MGILDIFFKKSEQPKTLDLSWLEVDMHSHLIPGIDDGAKSLQDSLDLIRRLAGYGLRKLVTTPHIQHEYYRNTPEIILGGLEILRKALKEEGISIQVEAAAEYYLDEIFLQKIKNGEQILSFGDQYVLVETGFMSKSEVFMDCLFQLEMRGFKPILAHPERYQYLIDDPKSLQEIRDRGVILQLNLLSLTGFYSKSIKDFAEMLVDKGLVHFMGTDCHNARYLDALETLPKHKYWDKIKNIEFFNTGL
jgi:protein-tyrosine phosphatase